MNCIPDPSLAAVTGATFFLLPVTRAESVKPLPLRCLRQWKFPARREKVCWDIPVIDDTRNYCDALVELLTAFERGKLANLYKVFQGCGVLQQVNKNLYPGERAPKMQ